MPFQHVDQISAWLEGTGIVSLELDGPQGSIRLGDDSADPVAASAETILTSPGCGMFLHHHPLSPGALAIPGARVEAGDIIGLLQIGVLLAPVPAPCAGHVAGHFVAHGETVDFGTKLISLYPLIAQATP